MHPNSLNTSNDQAVGKSPLPIFLNLTDRPCLVIGGGSAAVAKVRQLFGAGARITVIANAADAILIDWAIGGALTLHRRSAVSRDFNNADLAFIATEDDAVDRQARELARAAGTLCNVVDKPELSGFTMPAHVDRGPVTVAIGTSGLAPTLAIDLRRQVDEWLPERLGELADFAGQYRDAVKAVKPDATARRRFWRDFFSGPIADAILRGDWKKAPEAMIEAINRPADHHRYGRLTIIEAPDLTGDVLPLAALRRLHEADAIAFDQPLPPDVADRARRDAEQLDIGTSGLPHLKDRLQSGQRVVFLTNNSGLARSLAESLPVNEQIVCGQIRHVPSPRQAQYA